MNRRTVLGSIGGVGALGVGFLAFTYCPGNIKGIEPSQAGQEITVKGKVSGRSSAGHSLTLEHEDRTAHVYVTEPYYSEVEDISLGSCASATGTVDHVEESFVSVVRAQV